jgi:hypothetical protein
MNNKQIEQRIERLERMMLIVLAQGGSHSPGHNQPLVNTDRLPTATRHVLQRYRTYGEPECADNNETHRQDIVDLLNDESAPIQSQWDAEKAAEDRRKHQEKVRAAQEVHREAREQLRQAQESLDSLQPADTPAGDSEEAI